MRQLFRFAAVIGVLGSCVTWSTHATAAQGETPASTDAEVFAAVVRELDAEAGERTLLVDPRTLRPGMDVTGLDSAHVGPGTPARAQALQQLGIASTDILADLQCLFSTGVRPPPPPSGQAEPDTRAAACRGRPPFQSALIGEPRAGAGDEVTVPVFTMTTSSYRIDEYVLRQQGTRWNVVARNEIFVMYS